MLLASAREPQLDIGLGGYTHRSKMTTQIQMIEM